MPNFSVESFRVRLLRKEEIPLVLELCKAEGRHMGLQPEVESWFTIDPSGFFVAVNDRGEIIGCCAGVRLSDHHGNVGMYVVKPEYRGAGIGKRIWNEAIGHLEERNKGLSAVADLFPVYRDKAGFSHVAHWSVDLYKLNDTSTLCRRFRQEFRLLSDSSYAHLYKAMIAGRRGNGNGSPTPISRHNSHHLDGAFKRLKTMVPASKELLHKVINYEKGLHSYDRSRIVELTLKEKDCRPLVALRSDGQVTGYGCLKPNLQGLWMISPLYADNELIAFRLLVDLLSSLSLQDQRKGVVLKCPSNNESATSMLISLGFERQTYSLKRCYTQYVFNVPNHHIYAFHTSVFCSE